MTNKEIVRAFFEKGYNENDYAATAQLLADDYFDHSPAGARCPADAVGILKIVENSFPDMHVEILDLIEENNTVVGRFEFRATHSTEYMGVPATNRPIAWEAIEIFRMEGDKIVESWGYWPDTEILEKLKRNQTEMEQA